MTALLVPKVDLETVRKKLLGSGSMDKKRKITRHGELFEIPVLKDPEFRSYTSVIQPCVEYYAPAPTLKSLLMEQLDYEKLELLPRSWQILGDIVITSIHPYLLTVREQVGRALLMMYPYCKSVYLDEGIEGDLRRPIRTLIAVKGETLEPGSTIHRENGCQFKLDITKVMFSKGNHKERARMAKLGYGEFVVDMFAGIGYFTIPMAVHSRPEKILAIELNPDSHKYLVENIKLNNVEDIVEPVLGDCIEKTPTSAADRIIMGYVKHTGHYLKYGILALKPGGVLHYHDTILVHSDYLSALDEIRARIEFEASAQGRTAETLDWRRVKKFSPGVWHVVMDARIN
ncbi:MAG: class I SAM-dependent methyltransferase family protein [Methanosarcinales archaeon]|nr:class I SAM-dependent methyltransferase family protein [Methanosarcinales archaeon]